MEFRKSNLDDIESLIDLRKKQLVDEGLDPSTDIDDDLRSFFEKGINDGSIVEWVAEVDGKIVATGAVMFMIFPPNYVNKSGVRAYITNMYTEPEYRGRGIASKMIDILVKEAKDRDAGITWLMASDMGMPVYSKCGFEKVGSYMEFRK